MHASSARPARSTTPPRTSSTSVMDETGDRGADVIFDPIGGDQTETLWTCGALGGRYLAVGFNDDPESGLTGRALRKLSMANMTVMGVLLAYLDTPRDFRRFGINGFPPEVGQRVHEHLLELVAAGRIRPVVGPDDLARRGRGGARGPRRPAYVGPHRRGARAGERRRDRGRRGRADRARRLRRGPDPEQRPELPRGPGAATSTASTARRSSTTSATSRCPLP